MQGKVLAFLSAEGCPHPAGFLDVFGERPTPCFNVSGGRPRPPDNGGQGPPTLLIGGLHLLQGGDTLQQKITCLLTQ